MKRLNAESSKIMQFSLSIEEIDLVLTAARSILRLIYVF